MTEIDSGNFLVETEIDEFSSSICLSVVGGFCSKKDDKRHPSTGWPKCFYRRGCGFKIRILPLVENLIELRDGR